MASLDDVDVAVDERDQVLHRYSLKAVQAATNNFSEENMLGRGGFGPVYKVLFKGSFRS